MAGVAERRSVGRVTLLRFGLGLGVVAESTERFCDPWMDRVCPRRERGVMQARTDGSAMPSLVLVHVSCSVVEGRGTFWSAV